MWHWCTGRAEVQGYRTCPPTFDRCRFKPSRQLTAPMQWPRTRPLIGRRNGHPSGLRTGSTAAPASQSSVGCPCWSMTPSEPIGPVRRCEICTIVVIETIEDQPGRPRCLAATTKKQKRRYDRSSVLGQRHVRMPAGPRRPTCTARALPDGSIGTQARCARSGGQRVTGFWTQLDESGRRRRSADARRGRVGEPSSTKGIFATYC